MRYLYWFCLAIFAAAFVVSVVQFFQGQRTEIFVLWWAIILIVAYIIANRGYKVSKVPLTKDLFETAAKDPLEDYGKDGRPYGYVASKFGPTALDLARDLGLAFRDYCIYSVTLAAFCLYMAILFPSFLPLETGRDVPVLQIVMLIMGSFGWLMMAALNFVAIRKINRGKLKVA